MSKKNILSVLISVAGGISLGHYVFESKRAYNEQNFPRKWKSDKFKDLGIILLAVGAVLPYAELTIKKDNA